MSDGPYMSPTLKRCWQPMAERAALESFSLQELREAVRPALLAEGRELPRDFLRIATQVLRPRPDPQLWSPIESGEMERLRRAADGHPLALTIVDDFDDALNSQRAIESLLLDSMMTALRQCWDENVRAIEEHAERQAAMIGVAPVVRDRLKVVCPDASTLTEIARSLLGLQGASVDRAIPKHIELEDGPALIDTNDER